MRTCAVQRHIHISQGPFCMEIYKENAGRLSRGQHFVRACAVEMHRHFTRAILCGNLQGKCRASVLCEPAQWKCTWTFDKRRYGNLQGKCRTLMPRPVFCASLRSRNANPHVTRVILCGNSQGKCRTLPIPPRLNTGP